MCRVLRIVKKTILVFFRAIMAQLDLGLGPRIVRLIAVKKKNNGLVHAICPSPYGAYGMMN